MTNKEAAAILKTEDCDDCTFRGYSSCKLIKCSIKQAHCVAIEVLDKESSQSEFNLEEFKRFVEGKVDMQDLYSPEHLFMLLDEYLDMRGKEE